MGGRVVRDATPRIIKPYNTLSRIFPSLSIAHTACITEMLAYIKLYKTQPITCIFIVPHPNIAIYLQSKTSADVFINDDNFQIDPNVIIYEHHIYDEFCEVLRTKNIATDVHIILHTDDIGVFLLAHKRFPSNIIVGEI